MVGTLLRDDWQQAVGDELRKHAQGLQQSAQSAVQVVQGVRPPDPNEVLQQLQGHAQGLLQQAPVQQAQRGIVQLGGDVQQSAQDVNAQLQQFAQGLFPAAPPQPQAPTVQPLEPDFAQPSGLTAPTVGGGRYQDYARQAAAQAGIDPEIFVRQIQQESGFNPQARSPAGATGIAQIMPDTARGWGVDPNNPEASLDAAARNMAVYIDKYGGWENALRAYNAGPGRIEQSRRFDETNTYVQRILGDQRPAAPSAGGRQAQPASLPHSEEPASATDQLGSKWRTSFDHGAVYTGDYRTGTPHRGIDLVPNKGGIGTAVEAFHPGTVTQISRDSGAGGLMVYVKDADGLTHAYMHLAGTAPGLKVGDIVGRGQHLAQMGESGTEGSPHLHYEVRRNAATGDPLNALIDPRPYMAGGEALRTVGATGPRGAASAARPDEPWTIASAGQQRSVSQPMYAQQQPGVQVVGGALQDTAQRVGGFFSDVGSGAQQVVQGARELGRNIGPNLGFDDAELARRRAEPLSQSFQDQARLVAQPRPPLEMTPSNVIGGAFRMLVENPPATGIQLDDYIRIEGDKNKWIEDNNPLNNQPVPLVAGLTTMIAQQITSPLVVATFGPTTSLGMRLGAEVTELLAPRAAQWVANVAGKFASGAFSNGLQNGIFEATQPGATPEKVGMAVLLGAGLGGGLEAGAPAVKAVVRHIGREVSDAVRNQATRDAMESFARSEVGELNLEGTGGARQAGEELAASRTMGEASAVVRPPSSVPPGGAAVSPPAPAARRVTGRQRLPNYELGTPEYEFEQIARPLRESSEDGLLHLDLNTLPKNVLPLDPSATSSSATGVIKANPGGSPHTDDLRALFEANEQKRDFYFDQSDQGIPTVGADNLEEWFALNSIASMQTPVVRQVVESVNVIGMVRKMARDGREAGDPPEKIKADILKAVNDYNWTGPAGPNKRIGANKGYATGISDTGGIKTPTFAGNYGSAESRLYDPGITNDIHNWRAMNVDSSQVPAMRGDKQYMDSPHESAAANNKTLYRATEAIFNELGAEQGVDGYAFQSAVWDGIRAMQDGAPGAWKKWQQGDFKGAIADARAAGVFNRPIGKQTGAPEPGEISRAMSHPSVQAALAQWGPYLKDPIPPELGITGVARVYPGELSKGKAGGLKRGAAPLRPASLEFRQGERAIAEASAPVVRGITGEVLEQLGVDERGVMPWLAASHRVVEETPGNYVVHLPAGNVDTARYVAAEVGRSLNAPEMHIHYPDYRAPEPAGLKLVGTEDEVRALQQVLSDAGHATVRGPTGRSLQIPLYDNASAESIVRTLTDNGISPSTLTRYNGANERVPSGDYDRIVGQVGGRFEPTTAGRRGLLERTRGPVAEESAAAAGAFTAPGGAEPPGGVRGARGQASSPFSLNLGGAAVGGWAGSAATPEDATWDERLKNIGLGATAGLLGTAAITRRMGPPRAPARAVAGATEGFRAPGGPPAPTRGADMLEARASGPRDIPEPVEPGGLGEVHSNDYLLNPAGPDDTPLTLDERLEYAEQIDARYAEVQSRAAAIDETLRNPLQKPYRPPWAAGWSNDALIEIARRHDISPYQEAWWDTVGLETGSGEVRYDVGESGLKGDTRLKAEPTPTELRAERRTLAQEEKDLEAAAQQLQEAPDDVRLVKRVPRGAVEGEELPLPFGDAGTPEAAPSGPFATEQAGPSGNLAEDLVTRNGTVKPSDPLGPKPGLTEDAAGVVGRGKGLTGRGILDPTAVPEPSARARKVMPNLDAMLGDNMPEVRAQIEQSVNDNIALYEAYQQGRISHDSMVHDLATKVGMSKKDFLATPVGKGFSSAETVALQAAAVESQVQQRALAEAIEARGGVNKLSPEEVAYGLSSLLDAARLTAVAAGARSTAGRTLNALKIRIDATMSKAISASNEVISATRLKDQAKRAAARAAEVLEKAKELDVERGTVAKAAAAATEAGDPSTRGKTNIWQQIDDAYNDLDRYQAMTLHEKGDEFARLAKERAERAAARKASVRGAPEELLSALRAELKAEQKIFAGRKDTWESMAFWDSKAGEIAAKERADFRGGLYIEQQRKAAQDALKKAEADYERAWKAESGRQTRQTERAVALLERIGGVEPSKELLASFVKAVNSGDDLAAAKFLKGMQDPGWWGKATILRLAGLLSSTATHMANTVGNITQPILEVPSHALTVGIDWSRAKATGGERQAYWAELGPMLEAYGPGVLASWNDFRTVLRTGIAPRDLTDLSRVRAGFKSGSDAVDTVVEAPLRLLSAMDVLFRGGAFAMHANRVATRFAVGEGFEGAARRGRATDIVAHLEEYPELYQEAYDAASRMVFQERRTMPMPGALTKGVPGAIQRGAVSQVLPFIKTPANITAQGFGLTPLGFLGAGEAILNRGDVPTAKLGQQTLLAEERAARATVGTLIFGGFMALGAGTLTGGKSMLTAGYPQDPGEASTLPPGWREWSMRVEDGVTGNVHYVPYQNFGAAGVPMAMAALLTDSGKRKRGLLDGDEMTRAMTGIGGYVLDNTFMQGMSDAVNVLHSPERYAPRFVEGLVSSYGPYSAMGRQMQRAYGVAARNPREGFQGMVDALLASYPGAAGLTGIPEATNALGDTRSMGVSGIGAFASPVRSSLETDEPTLRVLRENDVNISPPGKELNIGKGQAIELTEVEQDRLKRARGVAIKRNVAAAQKSRDWQNASVYDRNAILRDALQQATQSSKLEFFRTLSKAEVEQRRKAAREIEPTYIGGTP